MASTTIVPEQTMSGSLILTSLEIGKALADHGRTVFRAQGSCMYPGVRPGDILHLESRTVEEVTVGDIAVCRRPGYLFAHRVVGKRVENGQSCILTRADTNLQGDDGPTFDTDLLGVVMAIERKGKRLFPRPPQFTKAGYALLKIRRWIFIDFCPAAQKWLAFGFQFVQHVPAYRQLGRLWLTLNRAKITYLVQLPLRAGQSHDLYHPLPPETFDLTQPTWQGCLPACWSLALFLGKGKQPAAVARFCHNQPDDPNPHWQLSDLQIRLRYRGLGLRAALNEMAEKIFTRNDVAFQRNDQ